MNGRARSLSFGSAVFLLYLALFAGIFHPVVFGGMTFVRRDIMLYYYPMWKYAAFCLKAGILPFWNPFANYGGPFLANPQTCVLNPLSLIFFQLPDFTRMFNVYIVVHFAMAASFTYLFMRGQGAARAAAGLAGLAFASTGYMMSSVNLTISLCSVAYFPLCLYAFRRALGESRFFWKGITAATLLIEYLSGDPAVLFATFFVFSLVVAYKALDASLKRDFRAAAAPVVTFVQTALAFLGLAAFHLCLFAELLMHSVRRDLSFGEAVLWSMHYNDFIGAFVPYFSDMNLYVMNYWARQSWLENYYVGIIVLSLATAALLRGGETAGRLALLALTGVALSLGQFSGIHGFLREYYPFFGFVRYPVRFFFLFAFAVSCLAGFGLDRVLSRRERLIPESFVGGASRAVFFATVIVSAALVLFYRPIEARVAVWAVERYGEVVKPFYPVEDLKDLAMSQLANIRRGAAFFLLAAAVIAAARRWRLPVALVSASLIGLIGYDLLTANVAEPFIKKHLWERRSENMEIMAAQGGVSRALASPKTIKAKEARVMKRLEIELMDQKDSLTSNLVMLHGFYDASGYDSIYLADTLEVQGAVARVQSPNVRLIDAMNIRHVVSPLEDLGPGYRRLHSRAPFHLYENLGVLPRAFLVERAVTMTDRAKLLARMKGEDFDPERELYIEESVPDAASRSGGRPGEVEFLEYGPNRVRMKVSVAGRPWLFFSDTFFPGWKALVDGVPAKIYRANYAFRALPLMAGEHEVVWVYEPTAFRAGLAVTGFTGLFFAAYYSGMGKLLRRPGHVV